MTYCLLQYVEERCVYVGLSINSTVGTILSVREPYEIY